MAIFEIPLSPQPQTMTVALAGVPYRLRFFYASNDMGGWCMDIADPSDASLACGIPLVTGTDLLAQYAYLDIGGALYVRSDGMPDATPSYADLGVTSHLYWVPAA